MKSWTAPILCMTLILAGGAAAQAQTIKPFATSGPIESITAPATTPPAAPSRLQAQSVSTDQILLIWQDNSAGETGFEIQGRIAGGTYQPLGTTDPNVAGVFINNLDPGTLYSFRVRAVNDAGNSAFSNEASDTTLANDAPCTPDATSMCLNGNRFRVQALYLSSQGQSGEAKAVKLTEDSGYLWFFSASNIEAVVKVLNGCISTNRYWVFAGGLTDVRVVLSVADTQNPEEVAVYVNPLGKAFQPIQDTTQALQSCP
jgi:hypothetical protein